VQDFDLLVDMEDSRHLLVEIRIPAFYVIANLMGRSAALVRIL
jgi:hypothetical protein